MLCKGSRTSHYSWTSAYALGLQPLAIRTRWRRQRRPTRLAAVKPCQKNAITAEEVQKCQKSRRIGCVIPHCKLKCGSTQPILWLFWHIWTWRKEWWSYWRLRISRHSWWSALRRAGLSVCADFGSIPTRKFDKIDSVNLALQSLSDIVTSTLWHIYRILWLFSQFPKPISVL